MMKDVHIEDSRTQATGTNLERWGGGGVNGLICHLTIVCLYESRPGKYEERILKLFQMRQMKE